MRKSANFKFRVVNKLIFFSSWKHGNEKPKSFSFVVHELENTLFSIHILHPLLINNSKLFAVTINRKSQKASAFHLFWLQEQIETGYPRYHLASGKYWCFQCNQYSKSRKTYITNNDFSLDFWGVGLLCMVCLMVGVFCLIWLVFSLVGCVFLTWTG